MRIVSFFVLVSGIFSSSIYACDFEKINALIVKNSIFAEFTQSKTLPALSRPLISKGKVWAKSRDELVWQVLSPIKSTIIIQTGGIKEFNKDDDLVTNRDYSLASDLSNVFLNLLAGNIGKLKESFNQNVTCNGDKWVLELKPNSNKFEDILSQISLIGEESVQRITLKENRGDFTEIDLTQIKENNTEEFEKYFEN